MHSAAQAYNRTAQTTLGPRELESHLLIKAASKFQAIKDDWSRAPNDLSAALLYNRKLWTIFASAVTGEEHGMPAELRQNIANLAFFIFKHTIDVEIAPASDKLDILIDINRNLAAGLRGNG